MASSEFVNVDAIILPAQQLPQNPNNIALFTTESAIVGVQDFTVHTSLKSVGDAYGTTSETYSIIANGIFSQQPNILTGNGSLTIIPFNGVNATQTTVTTEDLTPRILAFKSVSNGKIKATIDGVTILDVNGADFTKITTVNDIATVIQKILPESKIKLAVINGALQFKSLKYGVSSAVLLEAGTLSGTDLLDSTLLDGLNLSTVAGVNASGETLVAASTRILALPEAQRPIFEGVLTNLKFELHYATGTYLQLTASYFNSLEKIFINTYSSTNDTPNMLLVKDAGLNNFKSIYQKDDELLQMRAGVTGLLFSNNTSFPNLSQTLNKKQITGVTPALYLLDGDKIALRNAGVDFYIKNLGVPAYVSNAMSEGYIDDTYNKKIITLECLTAYDNALTVLTKIPQTQAGINFIAGQMDIVLQKLRTNGIVAQTNNQIQWNSNTAPTNLPFQVFQDIIKSEGYYIEIPNIAKQSQGDREARKCPPIPIYVQLAGAIHTISSIIYIQR